MEQDQAGGDSGAGMQQKSGLENVGSREEPPRGTVGAEETDEGGRSRHRSKG